MRGFTQQQVASRLHVNRAAVSKVERRLDMHISTLGYFIEAAARSSVACSTT
jgi:transcriptional regulator with XRE-family HTH domain